MAALLGVRLDERVHREFKILCVQQGRDMSEVVRELVIAWIAEQKSELSDGKEAGHDRVE